jgi:phenylacetate-coenzyme A ligase PaaK-like adenylate-forming protein
MSTVAALDRFATPAHALAAPASPERIRQAKERLDAHVRDTVAWHFSPETGTPFWLEKAKSFDFDPVKDVNTFEDLQKFPAFQDEWLRGGPVRRWVPLAYQNKPIYVFETGGSTGTPKSRINIEDFRIDYTEFSKTLNDATFPKGSNWLMLGPSGPRRLRLAIEHLAQERGGICFCIDLDPRWVIKLIKKRWMEHLQAYKDHCIEQAITILKSNHSVKCMFTTPKLLESLCEKIDIVEAGITGIFIGGTELTPQFHRFAREELCPGVDFQPTYGNTLMGLACGKPFVPEDEYKITYFPPAPRAVIEVVDFKDENKQVDYGQTGRVCLTTLTKELFMPRFLERDEAERHHPIELYPWDGAQSVRPFSGFGTTVVEGVY